MISESEYNELRAKYDENQKHRAGRTCLTLSERETIPHKDFGNDQTALIEEYELFHERPNEFVAYVSSERPSQITGWTGLLLGHITSRGQLFRIGRQQYGERKQWVTVRSIWGDTYRGISNGDDMYVRLKKVAAK